jgi:hypothetical protein
MAAYILGLTSAESYDTHRPKSVRRKVFHMYPNGAAPLTGLLTLLKEESTDDPEYKWYEDRYEERKSISAVISTTVCFYKTVVISTATWTTADGDLTMAVATTGAATIYGVKVADATMFRARNVIRFKPYLAAAAYGEAIGVIVEGGVDETNNRIAFRCIKTTTAIDYDHANNTGISVDVIGSAYAEGSLDVSDDQTSYPVQFSNYTQIFRKPFKMTGTAARTALWYDKSGPYKEKSKKASLDHMTDIERTFIFGEKTLFTGNGNDEPERTMGGVLWYLREYEKVNSTYRGGSCLVATLPTDENKRIIDFGAYTTQVGYLTVRRLNDLYERWFRKTNDTVREKLLLCGNGFLNYVNQLYFGSAALNSNLPMTSTFGMDVQAHRTPFGTVYYKTHPLFTQNSVLNYSALGCDVHLAKYTYMEGRDTTLLKKREPNDADYRKDEWLTECGLELHFPEAHMFFTGITDYA